MSNRCDAPVKPAKIKWALLGGWRGFAHRDRAPHRGGMGDDYQLVGGVFSTDPTVSREFARISSWIRQGLRQCRPFHRWGARLTRCGARQARNGRLAQPFALRDGAQAHRRRISRHLRKAGHHDDGAGNESGNALEVAQADFCGCIHLHRLSHGAPDARNDRDGRLVRFRKSTFSIIKVGLTRSSMTRQPCGGLAPRSPKRRSELLYRRYRGACLQSHRIHHGTAGAAGLRRYQYRCIRTTRSMSMVPSCCGWSQGAKGVLCAQPDCHRRGKQPAVGRLRPYRWPEMGAGESQSARIPAGGQAARGVQAGSCVQPAAGARGHASCHPATRKDLSMRWETSTGVWRRAINGLPVDAGDFPDIGWRTGHALHGGRAGLGACRR